METLSIEQTIKSPMVEFDGSSGRLTMKGKSIPENSRAFYQVIYDWVDQYIVSPAPVTIFDIQLDYFNTSSAKCIADLFKQLLNIEKNNSGKMIISWFYQEDDSDMQEVGEDFKKIVKTEFNLISYPS
jgi:hypothetical protein